MRFSCHTVDESFFELAPMRFKNVAELDAGASEVFSILADADSWPKWFPGFRNPVWTSKPCGVGSTRTVKVGLLALGERFFRWQQDRRMSFYLTAVSMPVVHALAEDYWLEEIGSGKTRFTYSVGMEPRLAVKIVGPITRAYFGSMFRNACEGLQKYVRSGVHELHP